jgi:hypothetical protein
LREAYAKAGVSVFRQSPDVAHVHLILTPATADSSGARWARRIEARTPASARAGDRHVFQPFSGATMACNLRPWFTASARLRARVLTLARATGMLRMEYVSLSLDEVRTLKKAATRNAPYADRVSLGFAIALACLEEELGEDHHVLHEIDVLEGLALHSSTKESAQFRRPPLHPLWHKHFSTARHLIRNWGDRWGLGKSGNRDLSKMIEGVATEIGDQPDLWLKRLAHQLVLGGLEDRAAAGRMTGDWIIFAKHEGRNFSLLF